MTRTDALPAPEAEGEPTSAALLAALEVDPAEGLAPAEVAARRARHGPNRMSERRARGALAILALQFRGIIVWLLAGAATLSLAVGDYPEAVAIAVVLVLNGAIGFFTELRAVRSIEALYRIAQVRTRVRRASAERLVDARDLVPGDIVLVEAGDIVTADLRLIAGAGIEADQSVLTGESMPVAKDIAPVLAGTPAAERADSLYKGSAVTHGSGEAVVTATGMATELGRITRLVETAEPSASPLERRLAALGRWLVWVTLALAGATAGVGILRGRDPAEMAETAIALAVAAVPEGLPVVATLCLARGLLRILRKNALVTRLSAVETLGAVTVILTDKTGTLTENRMTVRRFLLPEGDAAFDAGGAARQAPGLRRALEIGVLCSNATLDGEAGAVGDPMELALLQAGRAAGLERAALLAQFPEQADHAFDQRLRMMATVHARPGGHRIAVKGAPEAVIPVALHAGGAPLSEAGRAAWLDRARAAAGQGFRVLALAWKDGPGAEAAPYEGLTLAGLVCLADPLRPDVPAAIAACRGAGIRVVMLTGDHAETAAAIAREAGLTDDGPRVVEGGELGDPAALSGRALERVLGADVFARISPEQKLGLARLFQRRGEIVAMTGDGVNDAPSLKQADIGVAMGGRGTEVARQAAQMVLKDDRFPTIVTAVREGRIIFDNIRRFVLYLMSCNVSEVMLVGLAVAAGLPAPLLPLQILYLNLVTDVFPAFAVGLGSGSGAVMERPPRPPAEPIIDRRRWGQIAALGALLTGAAMGTFVVALGDPRWSEGEAVTIAFLTLALAQLWNVFNLRGVGAGILRNSITRNPFVWAALALCLALLAAALWLPGLSALMALPFPGGAGLLLALGGSLAPLLIWQAWLGLVRMIRV